jgi:hypothetical protein
VRKTRKEDEEGQDNMAGDEESPSASFEWDDKKRAAKLGIDFEDAIGVFEGPAFFINPIGKMRGVGSR